MFCPAQCFVIVRVGLRHIFHLTERDTRMLICIASDVRDRVRNRSQDNVTNINTGSGVRRIILKRRQCKYKSEQRCINECLLTRNALAHTHGISLVILKGL